MKKITYFVILLLLFFGIAAYASIDQSKFTILQSRNSPLVAIRVMVNVGSIDDPAGKEGLCALTGNLLANGGTTTLTHEEILKKLYPMAAQLDFLEDKEVCTFVAVVHKDNLDKFYQILSGLILKPRFDPADFKREKESLISDIKNGLRSYSEEELGKTALDNFIHNNHPYGHCNAGTVNGLESITLEDVKDFYHKKFTPQNMHVGIAGDINQAFEAKAKKDFSAVIEKRKVNLPAREKINQIEVIIIEKPCLATAISFGFPVDVTRSDKDFYPLMIANSAFGEHRTFHGRLMNHIRGARGFNYGDYSYIENFIQEGGSRLPLTNIPRGQQFFSVWIRPVPHAYSHFILRQAVRELELLVNEGLTKEEFVATQSYLINYAPLMAQNLSRRLGYSIDSKFYGTEYFIDQIQKELPKITLDKVNSAIKKYLQYKNIKVVIVTPDAKGLKEALLSDKPSFITYSNKGIPPEVLEEDKIIAIYPLSINKDKIKIIPVNEMFEK